MSKTFGRTAKCVKTIVVEMEDKQADSDAKDAEKAVMGSLEHEIIATGLGKNKVKCLLLCRVFSLQMDRALGRV